MPVLQDQAQYVGGHAVIRQDHQGSVHAGRLQEHLQPGAGIAAGNPSVKGAVVAQRRGADGLVLGVAATAVRDPPHQAGFHSPCEKRVRHLRYPDVVVGLADVNHIKFLLHHENRSSRLVRIFIYQQYMI